MTAAVRRVAGLLAVGVAVLAAVPRSPAPAAETARVHAAVAKGAEFLKREHAPKAGYTGGQHGLGSAALSGLAMLEAKVKPDDPSVQNVLRFVRYTAPGENQTYHTALAILFLDRFGDPADEPLIQYLGVRLYAGMSAAGGWTYQSGGQLSPEDEARLRSALQQAALVGRPRGKSDKEKPKNDDGFPEVKPGQGKPADPDAPPARLHPEVGRYFVAVRQMIRTAGRSPSPGDNSNTQFGLIGLWVAARHGVPADDAFALIEARFLTTQNPADGGWGYSSGGPGIVDSSTAAMTCAGLLGLAVGQARGNVGQSRNAPKKPDDPTPPDGVFDRPGKGGKKETAPDGGPRPIVPADRKRAIEAGLKAVGSVIRRSGGAPQQPQQPPPPANQPGIAFPGAAGGGGALSGFIGLGNEYYLLWSVERVGMAYGLDSIGDCDWYDWGCNFLLPAQQSDGSWDGARGYGKDVDTSFALLFLSRSNFVRDLSRKITGQVKDPGKAELRGTKDRPPLFAPPKEGGSPGPGSEKPPAMPPLAPTEPTPALPKVGTPSDPLADALVAATGAAFDAKLKEVRDARGSDYTAALVHAITKLDADRQKQAREALAERLTRMTANTLRTMLKESDAELRRAACLACAMKDDRQHVPDLIERITDQSDLVVRAARAGLKSLTEKDFGPPPGADEAAKAKAHADWKKWYETQGKP
jgi:hypothetical protein